MRLLILGLSSIVRRRVLTALRGLSGVDRIDVATRRGAQASWTDGDVYDDYLTALDHSKADVVYVSVVNSAHLEWTAAALTRGRHAVVDKPAFLGLDQAERMLDLAARRGVCLAEAIVFGYHRQVELALQQFRCALDSPSRLIATMSFPPMDPANFRYQRALGGGALWDLGPYAAAVGRVFFDADPDEVTCHVLRRAGDDGVETAFALLGVFSGGRSVVGTFGFDTVYHNRMDLLGSEVGIKIDRVFTTPPEIANDIQVTRREGTSTVPVPPSDAFAAFFAHVLERIRMVNWAPLAADLHRDARTLHRLRESAGME